jgi:hypothetical protein
VSKGDAELGFGDLEWPNTGGLCVDPIWGADVVLVSPIGTDLPPSVPLARLSGQRLSLPPQGSPRRKAIDDGITQAGGQPPAEALATDERTAWTSSAQYGIASYLSYETVAIGLENVELRPLDPPQTRAVGFIHQADALSDEADELLRLAHTSPIPTGCHPTKPA